MPLIDFFSPPTTSLYQFMALSGLVIFMFFKYLSHSTLKTYRAKVREAAKLLDPLSVKVDFLEKKSIIVKEDLARLRTRAYQNPDAPTSEFELRSDLSKEEKDKLLEEFRAMRSSYEQAFEDINNLKMEAKAKSVIAEEVKDVGSEYIKIVFYDQIASLLGLMLAFAGFILWYLKIQQYQDIILMHQALAK
ncbi:MAG: hypothetical protein LV481_11000 [Methylacidiphilales bacterium]|nr:hypothetical protein [Candidatus Methylacidiphilales bacterium]